MRKLPVAAAWIAAVLAATPVAAEVDAEGPEFRVNSYTTGLQLRPDVAHTGPGSFVVVWVNFGGNTQSDITARLFGAGGTPQGIDFRVNTFTTSGQESPAVDADASGRFVVVWQSYGSHDGNGAGIFGQRFEASGDPIGTEFQINTYTTGDQLDPAVGVAPDGSFVVAWNSDDEQDGDESGIFGRRFATNGSPASLEFRVSTQTVSYQHSPAIDVADDGTFIVVWTGAGQDDPGTLFGAGVFGQRYTAGGSKVGSEFQVNTYTTGSQQSPDVGIQPDGGFVVVWTDTRQLSDSGIFGRRYNANGSAAGGEFIVHSYADADKEAPRIAVGDDGGFLAVWSSFNQDGAARGVFGREFTAAAAPVGDDFQINTYTTNSQYRVAVSDDGAGELVVTWQQRESTPSDDIYAQRYLSDGGGGAGVCGDPVALVIGVTDQEPKVITASDALAVLRTAVALAACELCVCDVNDSMTVTAADALIVLRAAVGQPETLDCPACT